MKRDLERSVKEDLKKKMVFIGGPRQVGKTTFSLNLFPRSQTHYFNWDNTLQRKSILNQEFPPGGLLVLDELHKYRKWRGMIKGYYDSNKARGAGQSILVTGSARLDYYRFGGDSLVGRYHYWRLHPLSIDEIKGGQAELEDLMKFGGFPEPFLSGSQKTANRWLKEYRSRFLKEDLRDLEQVQDLGTFELMALRLPELVGSPLSINALREDLQVAHKTLSKWLDIYERLYGIFRLPPFGSSRVRAVKKEQKLYLYCWPYIEDEGSRFENLIACHLLKKIHWLEDSSGREIQLTYFRDLAKQEVDFVLVEKKKPILLLEVKLADQEISSSLKYLSKKFPETPAVQIHLRGKKDFLSKDSIRVAPAAKWLCSEFEDTIDLA